MSTRSKVAVSILIAFVLLTSGAIQTVMDAVVTATEWLQPEPPEKPISERYSELTTKIEAGDSYESLIVGALALKADAAGTPFADSTAHLVDQLQARSRRQDSLSKTNAPSSSSSKAAARAESRGTIPIDPDATIRASNALLEATVTAVRMQGYRCDSVTGIFTAQFSSKMEISLYCNQDAYKYRITDVGGTLLVEVK